MAKVATAFLLAAAAAAACMREPPGPGPVGTDLRAALAADDPCLAGPPCALSVLQARGSKVTAVAAAAAAQLRASHQVNATAPRPDAHEVAAGTVAPSGAAATHWREPLARLLPLALPGLGAWRQRARAAVSGSGAGAAFVLAVALAALLVAVGVACAAAALGSVQGRYEDSPEATREAAQRAAPAREAPGGRPPLPQRSLCVVDRLRGLHAVEDSQEQAAHPSACC